MVAFDADVSEAARLETKRSAAEGRDSSEQAHASKGTLIQHDRTSIQHVPSWPLEASVPRRKSSGRGRAGTEPAALDG